MVCSKVGSGVAWVQGWAHLPVVLEAAELSEGSQALCFLPPLCVLSCLWLVGEEPSLSSSQGCLGMPKSGTAMAADFVYEDFKK